MSVIVVMGVSGSGKTTIGVALADALGVEYADADAFHPQANIDKMRSGAPLTDEDRAPWLDGVAAWIRDHQAGGGVVSCSALKRRYRDVLRGGGQVWFLHLDGDRDVIAERMRERTGHFMPVSLLDSQLAALERLEPGEPGAVFDLTRAPEDIVTAALAAAFR